MRVSEMAGNRRKAGRKAVGLAWSIDRIGTDGAKRSHRAAAAADVAPCHRRFRLRCNMGRNGGAFTPPSAPVAPRRL